jgi:hypothetical protein
VQTIKGFEEVLHQVNDQTFDSIALRLFHYQAENNFVYSQYLRFLEVDPSSIYSIDKIPFLPISFFKSHKVMTGQWQPELDFRSSGTTESVTSNHFVQSLDFYQKHSKQIFEQFFGPLADYHILALLPSYLERKDSSLVHMVDYFIKQSRSTASGFYLSNLDALSTKLLKLKADNRKVLLMGVSFALLDLAEKGQIDLSHCLIMETGGMKGRRKELTRDELHEFLKGSFNVSNIYSEYGMTELLSQAYSKGEGLYRSPSSIKILVRDINDPFSAPKIDQTGTINIIDLANFNSCAFIETRDLGRVNKSGYFEVLGRMDNSDVRGCNLLVG